MILMKLLKILLVYLFVYLKHGKAKGGYDPEETDGGAIYCTNSSALVIENSRFAGNFADAFGGAISLRDTSNIIINNSVIVWNTAAFGGGINFSHSNPSLDNVTISGNAVSWHGGGIYCQHASPTLTNLTISDNTTNNYGGGIICGDYSNPDLNNVTISNNEASWGGGMYIYDYSNPVLDSVYIFDNTTDNDGGGMFISGFYGVCQPSMSNVKIYDNFVSGEGGGIYCYLGAHPYICYSQIYSNFADKGGGIYCIATDYTELEKVTVANNIANDGREIYVDNSNIILLSTIVWNDYYDLAYVYLVNGGTVTATYSDIQNASDEPWFGYGCIDADPLFANPATNDYTPTWSGYPLPDEEKSPCIDAGAPISPYDPDGTIADMGALYFHQSYTSLSGGDINGTLLAADSPYFVDGDLTIPAGSQLTIEPGVSVIFRGHYKFEVNGTLLAEGYEHLRINIAAQDTLEGFKGLRFINTNTARQDSSKLIHCRITFGNADFSPYKGGGLYFENSSNVRVQNCLINKNRANLYGGAIYCDNSSSPIFINNIITGNNALYGGAIYSEGDFSLTGGEIYDNFAEYYGGAIYLHGAEPLMSGATIRNNTATLYGGGFYFDGGNPVFSSTNRCNIYLNYAKAAGLDLYGDAWEIISVIVDTFTVLNPDKHFAYPYDDFTFDIQHYKIEQLAQDLYVSPSGSDDNSGISSSEPLQTMHKALLKIMADSMNPRTIHLENGTYSNSATGENFPINCRENVSISCESEIATILDGEEQTGILYCYDDSNFTLENLKMQNGYAEKGGAIYLDNSNPDLVNVICTGNEVTNDGGAIYCLGSSPNLTNVIITNNTSSGGYGTGGGGIWCLGSCPALDNVHINSNSAYFGGGIYINSNSHLTLNNVTFNSNSASHSGGGCYINHSDPVLNNVTFTHNDALSGDGGAIYIVNSDPQLYDVTITLNDADGQGGGIWFALSNLDITNSSIIHNISFEGGGGIFGAPGSTLNIKNTQIVNNSADEEPYIINGGALCLNSVTTTIVNTTIGYNYSSGDGDGIYCSSSNISLINSILWADTLFIHLSGTVNATYSDIQGGTGLYWFGTGCIDTYPLFADTSSYDLHLTDSSPCINAGNPDTTGLNLPEYDLDGNPRIVNGIIDMGCYEYQGGTLSAPTNITISISSDSVHISWDAVSGANSYKIYSSDDPYAEDWGDAIASVAVLSWTSDISGIEKKFYYVVASMETVRESVKPVSPSSRWEKKKKKFNK
ncbi:MAG: right-handed parallel beta-helix repeat-containing protein [Candidatus Cloacimonetes bacterium]|nr:right-handed parallel beta-helix repeat-containing protein [Candidatus Cloacimonadota bacterium]